MDSINAALANLKLWSSTVSPVQIRGGRAAQNGGIYGVEKLRKLIVDLGVRGALTQQNIGSESVASLVTRVCAEREESVPFKGSKKVKTYPEIPQEEKLYTIPDNWEWVRLGQIAEIYSGDSINAEDKRKKYTGGIGRPYIATKDVGYGFEALNYSNGVAIPHGEQKFSVAEKGSVLICSEGGSAGKKCGIAEQSVCFGNKLFAAKTLGGIDPKFILAVYLSSGFCKLFSEKMTGIIGGISSTNFKLLPIPLPPIEEQSRIVSKIDDLMLLCDGLNQMHNASIQSHELLIESLFDAVVNSSIDDPCKELWELIFENFATLLTTKHAVYKLRQVILDIAFRGKLIPLGNSVVDYKLESLLEFGPRNGLSPSEVKHKTDIKVLKLGATSYGELNLEETKFVDVSVDQNSHLFLRKGDILIQRGNSHKFVGCNVLILENHDGVIYPDLMMKIRANELVTPEFLSLALGAPQVRRYLWEHMSGKSGTMPKINKKLVP